MTEALTAWRAELATADDGLDVAPAPAERLALLRAELARRGIDGFVVPRADEHQGEYVPRRSQRLGWLTGFSGSAGLAIVLADRAAIFIDGRYTLAVRDQVDVEAFVPHQIPGRVGRKPGSPKNLPKGGKLGFDPWLQTVDGYDRFARACQRAGGSFVPVEIQSRRHGVARAGRRRRWRPCCRIPSSSPARPARAKRGRIASTLVAREAPTSR